VIGDFQQPYGATCGSAILVLQRLTLQKLIATRIVQQMPVVARVFLIDLPNSKIKTTGRTYPLSTNKAPYVESKIPD
jgi:hypothetical protein